MPKCTLRQLKSHTFHVQSSDKSGKFIFCQIGYFYMKIHYNEYPQFSIHGEIRKSLIIFIIYKVMKYRELLMK